MHKQLQDFLEVNRSRMADDAVDGLAAWFDILPEAEAAREEYINGMLQELSTIGDATETGRIYLINVQNVCALWENLPPPGAAEDENAGDAAEQDENAGGAAD